MEPSELPKLTDEAESLGDQGVSHRRCTKRITEIFRGPLEYSSMYACKETT